MRCSNCGKDVPFVGNVCNWCNANKQGDQMVYVASVVGIILGGLIGFGGLSALGVESFGVKSLTALAIAACVIGFGFKAKGNLDRAQKK